ncbi:MAG: hypothetical protein ACI8P0_006587 [Planctomycetaceae bacterium]
MLEGLRGKAADSAGAVSWSRLVLHVTENVNASAKQWFEERAKAEAARRGLNVEEVALQTPHELRNMTARPVVALIKALAGSRTGSKPPRPAVFVLTGSFTQDGTKVPAGLNLQIDGKQVTGEMQAPDTDGTTTKLLISGTIEGTTLKAKTYYRGSHWSNWVGEFDRERRTFAGTYQSVARVLDGATGSLKFATPK